MDESSTPTYISKVSLFVIYFMFLLKSRDRFGYNNLTRSTALYLTKYLHIYLIFHKLHTNSIERLTFLLFEYSILTKF